METIYGFNSIILFNIAIMISYKVYHVCNDMAEFTNTLNLPDEAS